MPDNPEIDIVQQAGNWPDKRAIAALTEKAISVTIDVASLKLRQNSELSVVLSNDDEVQALNKSWRKIDKPTNVLSFPVENILVGEVPGMLLGDIVLSFETITREAENQGVSFDNHFLHLVIHGFLHIFGYDHTDDKEAVEMETLEISCLSRLGIANPYNDDIV